MIDFHTHPVMIQELVRENEGLARAVREVFGLLFPPQPLEIFLRELAAAGIERAVLLPVDCTTAHGCRIPDNEAVAELAGRHEQFLGFASVDPGLPDAPKQLERAVRSLGLRGLKLDPSLQRFFPNDRERAYPLYAACGQLRIPVLLHGGLSWAPPGQARFANPTLLEEPLQEFPETQFVLAHFGWPWVGEALMLALKYRNLSLDTSVVFARTPAEALHQVLAGQVGLPVLEGSLPAQLLFGSNYPRQDIRRAVRGVRALGLSPGLEERLFRGNAACLLRLEDEG
jgi:predicted TIM-barrel fold metal-dependent hydrolase